MWLNEKHIEEGLDHKYLWVTTVNYLSDYRKGRYNLVVEPKKQPNKIFLHKRIANKVTKDCRTTAGRKPKTRLGFKQCDVIFTKEQSVLTKIKKSNTI